MRLNRNEIDQRYPAEELRIQVLDDITLIEGHIRDIKRHLMNKQWAAMANSAKEGEHAMRGLGFTLNRILFPTLQVDMSVPDDTPKESER